MRAELEMAMELKRDDWVKTESGETGKVVHTSRLTVFVATMAPGKEDRMEAFLESQLTKIEPPTQSLGSPRIHLHGAANYLGPQAM
jgi:hypothetical protein